MSTINFDNPVGFQPYTDLTTVDANENNLAVILNSLGTDFQPNGITLTTEGEKLIVEVVLEGEPNSELDLKFFNVNVPATGVQVIEIDVYLMEEKKKKRKAKKNILGEVLVGDTLQEA